MTGIQYPVDIKDIGEFEHQNNISVNVYAYEDKKIFPPRLLQDITWIYYISPLVKSSITYWCTTWANWYRVNSIITNTKDISANIVCIVVLVKRYWKTIRKDASFMGAKTFLDKVIAAATICRQYLANKIPMKRLTLEQWREYNNILNYSICTKPFKSANKKVRDTDHLTGEYRGPTHNACNLNYRIDPKKVKIPCIVQNLKGTSFLCYSYFHIARFWKSFW